MYPFYVLGSSHDASDEEVAQRYHDLLQRYPPDRAPQVFARIRAAFGSLQTRRDRVRARLFYFDDTGRSLADDSSPQRDTPTRQRLSTEELAAWLKRSGT